MKKKNESREVEAKLTSETKQISKNKKVRNKKGKIKKNRKAKQRSENQNVKNENGKVKDKNENLSRKAKWRSEKQNVKNKNGKVKNKNEITKWPPWASVLRFDLSPNQTTHCAGFFGFYLQLCL